VDEPEKGFRKMRGMTKQLLSALLLIIAGISALKMTVGVAAIPSTAPITVVDGNVTSRLIWEKTYGGTGDDRAFYLAKAKDGYLVVGSSSSQISNLTVAWALRLDSKGDAVWNKTYPEASGSELRYVVNAGEDFLLVGNVFLPSGDQNGYVVKIDGEGNPLWTLTVGGDKVDKLFSAAKTSDGGFILVGLTSSWGAGGSDAWIVKIDGNGEVLWNETHGGKLEDTARGIAVSNDNGFLVVGYTNSFGHGDYDFLLLKINENGTFLWNRTYGGPASDKAIAVAQSDAGFIVVGETQSQGAGNVDAWIMSVDSSGQQLWERTLGGANFDTASCIAPTEDGSFLVGGFTFSFGSGMRDFWISKIEQDGRVSWSAAIGRSGYEEAYGVVEVKENEFVSAGWTDFTGQGRYDFYVVDAEVTPDSMGNVAWLIVISVGSVAFVVLLFAVAKLKWRELT